jgi:eight-cysteine-cluster-containing protein
MLHLFLALAACVGVATGPAPRVPTPLDPGIPVAEPGSAEAAPALPAPSGGAPESDGGLLSRIEGPSTPGECASDADCATAGCAGEVCVAGARASGVITTCEVLPVFSDLKACGCHGGECTWVREAGARPLGEPRTLAVPLLPTGG